MAMNTTAQAAIPVARTDKLKQHQYQLTQVRHTRFPGIVLQIGIGNKTNRCIKCKVSRHGWIAIRIKWQPAHVHQHKHGK